MRSLKFRDLRAEAQRDEGPSSNKFQAGFIANHARSFDKPFHNPRRRIASVATFAILLFSAVSFLPTAGEPAFAASQTTQHTNSNSPHLSKSSDNLQNSTAIQDLLSRLKYSGVTIRISNDTVYAGNKTTGFDDWLHSIIHYEMPASQASKDKFFFAAKYLIQKYQSALGSNIISNLKEIVVSDPQHNKQLQKWGTFGLSFSDRIIITDKQYVDFNYNILSMELSHHFMLTLQSMYPSAFAYNDWNNLVHYAANHMGQYASLQHVSYNHQQMLIFVYNFNAMLKDPGQIRQNIIKELEATNEHVGPVPINPYRNPVEASGRPVVISG
jgi:hypothetical protein